MSWFARAARLKSLPVALWPAVLGLAYARFNGFDLDPVPAFAALVATAALHVGACLREDLLDHREGAAKVARMERASIATGSGAVLDGRVGEERLMLLSFAALVVSLASWAATYGRGAGAVAVLLVLWRIRPAWLREVLGAAGRAAVLPASYAALTRGAIPGSVIALTGLAMMFALLVRIHEDLLQWRADRAVGRSTIAATFEDGGALTLTGALGTVTYVLLVLLVAFRTLPPSSLIALVTAAPLVAAWGRARRDPSPQLMLKVLGASLGASLLTGVILTLSVLVQGRG